MTADDHLSQKKFVLEYFKSRPYIPISHIDSKVELETSWEQETGKRFEDSDRTIRRLHQDGFLVKLAKGVYMYDPTIEANPIYEDFTAAEKSQILERDNFRCVVCHLGEKDGIELQVDHIRPKDRGGTASIENGQTLCARHNFLKKNHSQTEFAKRVFVKLYEESLVVNLKKATSAEAIERENIRSFVIEVLNSFEKYGIDDHVEWKPAVLDENEGPQV